LGSEAVPEVDGSGDCQGDEGCAEEGVGYAAMVFEERDRAAQAPQNVEVGRLGGQGHGQGGIGGAAVESCAGETGSGEEVGDGFHWVPV